MSILRRLEDPALWEEFYTVKTAGGHLDREEAEDLRRFLDAREYLPTVAHILQGGTFQPPKKAQISKLHSEKKRTVYSYRREENYILKALAFLLRHFDGTFSPNLYSFRRDFGVRRAIAEIIGTQNLSGLWVYKVDIHNYFNSVKIPLLLPKLRHLLAGEPAVYDFLASLLENPNVEENGVLHPEEKGIMAGTPISPFLANVYLMELDWDFYRRGVLYARYSDDILVFAPTEEALEEHIRVIRDAIDAHGLTVNPEKEARFRPGEGWDFLGIHYCGGQVDVSPVSIEKLKQKMRRKTRALIRWRARKDLPNEKAAIAFIRSFNRKFFSNPSAGELTWARWYFPLITTDAGLRQIDHYMQECIRYLATGSRTKARFNFRYAQMKEMGYVNLVNAWYSHKNGKDLW